MKRSFTELVDRLAALSAQLRKRGEDIAAEERRRQEEARRVAEEARRRAEEEARQRAEELRRAQVGVIFGIQS